MMQPGDMHTEYIDQDVYGEEEEDSGSNSDRSDESSADEEDSSGPEEMSWKQWFLALRGNEFFCEVDDEFIEDDFNLTGLNSMVPYYDYALDVMLDVDISMENLSEEQRDIIDTAAEVLYGLIHARFILTIRGMELMLEKFQQADFGRCPRVCCAYQPVLPVGQSDIPRNASVHVFCCKCHDVFYPRSTKHANVDGAFFGTTFCHLFLLTHAEHIPAMPAQRYLPRIYGFRIHGSSPYYTQRALRTEEENEGGSGGGGGGARASGNGSRRSGGGGGGGGTAFGDSHQTAATDIHATQLPHQHQHQHQHAHGHSHNGTGGGASAGTGPGGMEEDGAGADVVAVPEQPSGSNSGSRLDDARLGSMGFEILSQPMQQGSAGGSGTLPPQPASQQQPQHAQKAPSRGLSSFGGSGSGSGANRSAPASMPPPAVVGGGGARN